MLTGSHIALTSNILVAERDKNLSQIFKFGWGNEGKIKWDLSWKPEIHLSIPDKKTPANADAFMAILLADSYDLFKDRIIFS